LEMLARGTTHCSIRKTNSPKKSIVNLQNLRLKDDI